MDVKERATAVTSPPVDGRSRRWEAHREQRRRDLLEAAIGAIRRHGAEAGLEQMAAAAGVSKTVLYRHFADKNEIVTAVMEHVAGDLLLPRILTALSPGDDDRRLIRAVIAAYVGTVVDEPELYGFVNRHSRSESAPDVVATTEEAIAGLLTSVLVARLRDGVAAAGGDPEGVDDNGVRAFAYGLVGMVHLTADWWLRDRPMSPDDLVDHLTMLASGGLAAVMENGGSPRTFWQRPYEPVTIQPLTTDRHP